MAVNPRIEAEMNDWLNRKGIMNEQKALMAEHIEEVQIIMEREGLKDYTFTHSSGLIVKLKLQTKENKRLDKTGLAEELDVEKSDLTTAGMVSLANDGVLKEKHINDHTIKKNVTKLKVKTKTPKEKK